MKPRVLLSCSDLSGGGAERELANVANGLDPGRVEVHVALWRDHRRYPLRPEISVHLLDKHRATDLAGVVWRTRRLLRALRPAAIYSVLPFPNLSLGLALVGHRPRPYWVARVVNDPEMDVPRWLRPGLGRVLRRADEVHACSLGVARATEVALGLRGLRVFDNPLDPGGSEGAGDWPEEAAPILLFVGRLGPAKRVDRLIGALARVRAPFVAWLLGEGPEEAALRAQVRALGLADRVHFFGFRPEPWGAFRRARALVLTSHWEGFPNVIVEAAACGLATVATDCRHGPAELIEDGVNGRLLAEGDEAGLVAALEQALREPERARAWGEEAERRIRARFGGGRAIRRYVDLLTARAGAPGRAGPGA